MRIERERLSCPHRVFRGAVCSLVVVIAAGLLVSCASVKTPEGTFSAGFFQNPNRVWEGIDLTLEILGYEIESSNRADGVLRAVPTAESESPGTVLEINQVMNTDDKVSVYVKGVAADPGAPPDQDALDKAANEFLTVLTRKVGR